MDSPGIDDGNENRDENELALRGEEDRVQEDAEEQEVEKEESSLLQEVLNSLKTPLASCSLGMETEDVVLKMEGEVKEAEREEFEIEEGEEMKEEEPEVDEAVSYQAATSGSVLLGHTTEEEEEDIPTVFCQEEVVPEEEETEEEEVAAVEQFSQHGVCISDDVVKS